MSDKTPSQPENSQQALSPTGSKLDQYFSITLRGSNVRQEVLAGLTTFLAMVYSVIVFQVCWARLGLIRVLFLSLPVWSLHLVHC